MLYVIDNKIFLRNFILGLFVILCNLAFAFDDSTIIEIPQEKNSLDLVFSQDVTQESTKAVKINTIVLDSQDQKALLDKADHIANINAIPKYIFENDFDIDLKMNNVPVLDQGEHGTCMTFAITALIDAIKASGDYISQQCLLELGNYYISDFNNLDPECSFSGWEGFDDPKCLLKRIDTHGIVAKADCPHAYPLDESSLLRFEKMSINDYKILSYNNQWAKDYTWVPIVNPNSISAIKKALNNNNRVLIASMVKLGKEINETGYPINNKKSGLWALPTNFTEFEKFIKGKNSFGLHAMVVTGYSDKHKILKIRNSWGNLSGDNGDYYMTYDYYRLMNLETIEISGQRKINS